MKKNLVLGFLILFLLSATAFAGTKNVSEKSANINLRENKLSDEELSRMSKRAEIDNLSRPTLSKKEMKDSRNDLRASTQIVVENRHHGYYYGGAGLLPVIVLVIVLI